MSSRGIAGETAIGLGLAALGLFIALQTASFEVSPAYAKVGPRLFPALVAAGLVAVGLWLTVGYWRTPPEEDAPPSHWQPLAVIALGLIADILLIERTGFVIASAVLFYCVAWGFGSRRVIRDAAVAIGLALFTYLGFTRGLGLDLPGGVFAGML